MSPNVVASNTEILNWATEDLLNFIPTRNTMYTIIKLILVTLHTLWHCRVFYSVCPRCLRSGKSVVCCVRVCNHFQKVRLHMYEKYYFSIFFRVSEMLSYWNLKRLRDHNIRIEPLVLVTPQLYRQIAGVYSLLLHSLYCLLLCKINMSVWVAFFTGPMLTEE